ncbi:hypothetical protein POM88_045523 [Heracleum sosnowskyi]|uniref:Reverse transcriptase zinc-binding domain-containing protein n=1 Tax=Heracleum sosnowskyi TaxID=360622 RepID=A0AAD8H7F5_9APIA|nr:hypothetical protein POM88_045523 [Heracleum sosnowskyi]
MDLLSQGALLLNCQIGKWPMKYLGVPIGVSHKKKVFWKPLIQKMDQKLASWKAQSLNEAGRLTLLKSVVESLPVYWLSIFKLPKGISKHMERLRRDFYWSHYKTTGSQNKKKMHLVAWEKICSPKKAGGLGLVSFETKNMALLSKWCSKWRLDRDRSWNKWMRYKYLCPKSSNVESFPEGSKKSDFIVSLADIQVNSPLRNDLSPKNFSWKLNNGYLVLFWEDSWFQGRALKDSFKSLYRISALKEVEVRIFYDLWECYEHQSEVFWTRNLRNCELEDMESLNKILENVRLSNSSDKLLWAVSGDTFTVKDGVKRIHDLFQHDLVQWSSFWNLKVPAKVLIFLWKLHSKILPTKNFHLSRIGSSFGSSLCSLCLTCEETIDHLFWECMCSKNCWRSILDWWGHSNKNAFNSLSEMWSSIYWYSHPSLKKVWHMVIVATLWTMWLVRNETIFRNQKFNLGTTTFLIKLRVKEWALAVDLINKDTLAWWDLNPVGSITRSEILRKQTLLLSGHEFIGFIDGSWRIKNGVVQAGIGGLLKDASGASKMTFSGPVLESNPLNTEMEALITFLNILKGKNLSISSLMIYTDNAALVELALKIKALGIVSSLKEERLKNHFRESHISLGKISRFENLEADGLAKNGAIFKTLTCSWF